VLQVPYADDRELIMDILKYGPDVEVLEPAALRERVRALLAEALQKYASGARFGDLLEPRPSPAKASK
jgi:proteasome accessory factor C